MRDFHSFYVSKAWRDLSWRLKVERGGKCERCGRIFVTKEEWAKLIAHHKKELNSDTVNDPTVALNPDNIEILCLDCHNKEHRRFGFQKNVYLVWGSPCSGKSTYVREMMCSGDIVLDINRLWEAVTMCPAYIKPDAARFNVLALRDDLLGQIKRRYGKWGAAYVIGGYPNKYERDRVAAELGAVQVFCPASKDECLRRRAESGKPPVWDEYIADWWAEYERAGE